MKTGSDLAQWARARLFPVGDPLDAIAEVIAHLHGFPRRRLIIRSGSSPYMDGTDCHRTRSQVHPTPAGNAQSD